MAYPALKRQLTCGDIDCDGNSLVCGHEYDLEWLRPNHVGNGSFESGVDYLWERSGGGSITASTTTSYSGTHSAYWANDGSGAASRHDHNDYMPVRRDRDYVVRLYAAAEAGDQISIRWTVWWYNSAYQYIGGDSGTYSATAAYFVPVTDTITPPATAAYAYLFISSIGRCFGYVDTVQFWPSLDQQEDQGSGWTTDVPSFAELTPGVQETLTMYRHWSLGTGCTGDDPTLYLTRLDGSVEQRRGRTQRKTHTLVSGAVFLDYGRQLQLFHHKVRGDTFEYYDSWSVLHTVRWPGEHGVYQIANPNLTSQTITLVEDDPTWP